MKKISVVVPCFNEEESIPLFYEEIRKVATSMQDRCTFEFIFVNDGSKDKTLSILFPTSPVAPTTAIFISYKIFY